MQARLRKVALMASAAALLAVSTGVAGVTPVQAAPGEGTCTVVAAVATIHSPSSPKGGLFYPATDPGVVGNALSGGPDFTWSLSGNCINDGRSFSSSGTGRGWCGRSVGQGSGTLAGRPYTVSWQSAGTQLVLLDPSAAGSVNAQANPPGSPNGSCADGSARTFIIDGVLTNIN